MTRTVLPASKGPKRQTALERFNTHAPIGSENECWLWTGTTRRKGYGVISGARDYAANGKRHHILAHRFSYELFVGPIPDGLHICHHCDIPACVNPKHLFVGTNADNIADCLKKGRTSRGKHRPSVAKLSSDDVRAMRQQFESGATRRMLAERYGVHRETVRQIVNGQRRPL